MFGRSGTREGVVEGGDHQHDRGAGQRPVGGDDHVVDGVVVAVTDEPDEALPERVGTVVGQAGLACCSASAPVHRPAMVGRSWVVTAASAWSGTAPAASSSNQTQR